ncbi:MAG: DUF2007 domain-containing protein [Candidatus Marinimicrobia bacterium]|nr:DUF2007 domain-containing protein [Candidatus Neomarinimicrobiota bacterium]
MAKAALSDENIPSFIKGDFLSTAYGIKAWDAPGGKAVLFVPEEFFEKATSIIENFSVNN